MKKSLALSLTLAATLTASATTVNDTIIDVRNAHRVVLTEHDSLTCLTIDGRGNDAAYHFDYTKATNRNSTALFTEKADRWNFDGTLSLNTRKRKNGSSCKHSRNAFTMGGFAFGFVNAVDAPQGVTVDMASSYELYVDLLGIHRYSRNDRHKFSIGLGLDWRNYRLKGQQRFVKEGNDIVLDAYPANAAIDFSRIKVFSLAVPIKYTWLLTKRWSLYGAAILNFNTYASVKTRYELDGHKFKDITKNIHQTPVTVDFNVGLKYYNIGVYAKYSPCDVLNDTYGPGFKSFSTGFTIGF